MTVFGQNQVTKHLKIVQLCNFFPEIIKFNLKQALFGE
jgi:hypothetical protein